MVEATEYGYFFTVADELLCTYKQQGAAVQWTGVKSAMPCTEASNMSTISTHPVLTRGTTKGACMKVHDSECMSGSA